LSTFKGNSDVDLDRNAYLEVNSGAFVYNLRLKRYEATAEMKCVLTSPRRDEAVTRFLGDDARGVWEEMAAFPLNEAPPDSVLPPHEHEGDLPIGPDPLGPGIHAGGRQLPGSGQGCCGPCDRQRKVPGHSSDSGSTAEGRTAGCVDVNISMPAKKMTTASRSPVLP